MARFSNLRAIATAARRAWPFLLTAAILGGVVSALLPFTVVLERDEAIRTQVRRMDLLSLSDVTEAQFEGKIVRLDVDAGPTFTLAEQGAGQLTSPPIDLGGPATSAGLHWRQRLADGATVSLALRTSGDGSSWSPWYPLEAEGEVTTGDGPEVFSNLAALDDARLAQYRVEMTASGPVMPIVSGLQLFLFDSSAPPVRSALHLRLRPRGQAEATIKPLGIVSRRQWGADERLRFTARPGQPPEDLWPEEVQSVEKIVVHHTAGANVCSSADSYCQRRSVIAINDIYYYHAVVNGWGDIGYNSLIGYDGRIYEGRAGPEPGVGEPLSQPVVAGHAFGYNQRTHGIALMGDFQTEPVPDLEYEALATMVGWIVRSKLAAWGNIDPLAFSGYRLKDGQERPALPNIVGHRDLNETECPGEMLYSRLGSLRERVKRLADGPPVEVRLFASLRGDRVTYRVTVDNHEPEMVRRLEVKAGVPTNADYVESWAGAPGQNRGVFDGTTVTWYDPEAKLQPGSDHREYAFVVRLRPGVPRSEVKASAWALYAEPSRGLAMSETVNADQRVEMIADAAAGGRVRWTGDWPAARDGVSYYGDDYQRHSPGDPAARYTWEMEVLEPGRYEVSAWWPAAEDGASDAPFTVLASDGPHTVRANQKQQGGQWNRLGTYEFGLGPARVTLGTDADGVVVADAIRLRQTTGPASAPTLTPVPAPAPSQPGEEAVPAEGPGAPPEDGSIGQP